MPFELFDLRLCPLIGWSGDDLANARGDREHVADAPLIEMRKQPTK